MSHMGFMTMIVGLPIINVMITLINAKTIRRIIVFIRFLDTLLNNPDLLQMKLANIILKGRAHTGRFLISLENKGFIERIPSRNGHRLVMRSRVTNEGKKIHSKVTKEAQKLMLECSEDIPDEMVEILQKILKQIRNSMQIKFDVKFE